VDEIVFLDGGRVAERGTHAELLAAGGRYADAWWEERVNDPPVGRAAAVHGAPVAASPAPTPPGELAGIPTEGSDTP
jgi:ATP-binding cassette subfamily B protein